jgi:YVTN family beta-propeller protein
MVNTSSNIAGTDRAPSYVSVIDGATNNVIANVEVGGQPFSNPAVNETTNKIYVMNAGFGGSFRQRLWLSTARQIPPQTLIQERFRRLRHRQLSSESLP